MAFSSISHSQSHIHLYSTFKTTPVDQDAVHVLLCYVSELTLKMHYVACYGCKYFYHFHLLVIEELYVFRSQVFFFLLVFKNLVKANLYL